MVAVRAEGLSTMRLMTGKRAETLLELMHQIERYTLVRAWTGLTDAEFFWEPFTTTWSIRRQDDQASGACQLHGGRR